MSKYKVYEFKGMHFILEGGALTTPEDLRTFNVSYAHIGSDGKIRRYREVIGDRSDLKYTGEEVDAAIENTDDMLADGWFTPPKKVKATSGESKQ